MKTLWQQIHLIYLDWRWPILALAVIGFALLTLRVDANRRAAEQALRDAPATVTITVSNVIAVAMHEPGQYTVLFKDRSGEIKTDTACRHMDCYLVADVPEGSPMYMSYGKNPSGFFSNGVIHIHGGRDLQGGGWQSHCGKGCTQEHQNTVLDAE